MTLLMKLTIAFFSALLLSTAALAVTATWTGRSEMVTTVTYQQAFKCEYQYAGQNFWRLFTGYCPPTVEIQ